MDVVNLSTNPVSAVVTNRLKFTTEGDEESLCSLLKRGAHFVTSAICSFTTTLRWGKRVDGSTIHSPSESCHHSPPEEIEFTIAGTKMKATKKGCVGTFHAIPKNLWDAIIGFHRQVSIDHSAESITMHRWHEPTGEYHTLIPYQKTQEHGLSVSVDWADKRNEELLNAYAKEFGEEFLPACTIHTHVDISAFESGVDASDEREAPGWHITLGKLITGKEYDTDFRFRIPRRKAVREVLNVNGAFKLNWNNLFADDPEMKEWIHTTPGTTDWHNFLNRVEVV